MLALWENCIFVHMTDEILFPVTAPTPSKTLSAPPWAPQSEGARAARL